MQSITFFTKLDTLLGLDFKILSWITAHYFFNMPIWKAPINFSYLEKVFHYKESWKAYQSERLHNSVWRISDNYLTAYA